MILILFRRRRPRGTRTKVFLTLATFSLLVGLITMFLPLQPGAVDMRQIVNFLNYGDRSDWRYLTFGFGDQLALLSTLTTATTIDGSYHTARTLPELRLSGIGQIDTAYWFPDGLSKLDPILQKAGDHGVRWGFVNVLKYVPVLERNGWTRLRTLVSGVQIWENPDAKLPQPSQPPQSDLASFSWGTLPILSLVTALSLGSLRLWPAKAEEILRTVYYFVAALIPLGLCFWYYERIGHFPHDRVYFIYTDALFFLGDALLLLAVGLWLSTRIAQTSHLQINRSLLLPSAFCILLFL